MISPVTVFGGTGRVGRAVVARLLRDGAEVRVVSREPRRARDLAGVTLHRGDIRVADGLAVALEGAGGVLVSVEPGLADSGPDRPETTMYQGVRNVLAACPPGVRRFVLVSQIYVTRSDHPMNRSGRLLDWRLRGEDAVRASGVPYTIVRPSWLTTGPSRPVLLDQGDRGDGKITIEDVAEACYQSFLQPAAAGKTFEMYNAPTPDTDWPTRFTALLPDT